MNKKAKRTPLGWSETSSGTYHLRVEIAGQATRRVVACGARVEKDSTILTYEKMRAVAKTNGNHICQTCLNSPLLKTPSVKWGGYGFIEEDKENSYIYLRYPDIGINISLTLRQLKKLHEKIGDYLALVEPPQTATVTVTHHAPNRYQDGQDYFIPTIKCVRDHLGLTLASALSLVKGKPLPLVVFKGDIKKAKALAKDLNSYGVSVAVK